MIIVWRTIFYLSFVIISTGLQVISRIKLFNPFSVVLHAREHVTKFPNIFLMISTMILFQMIFLTRFKCISDAERRIKERQDKEFLEYYNRNFMGADQNY